MGGRTIEPRTGEVSEMGPELRGGDRYRCMAPGADGCLYAAPLDAAACTAEWNDAFAGRTFGGGVRVEASEGSRWRDEPPPPAPALSLPACPRSPPRLFSF